MRRPEPVPLSLLSFLLAGLLLGSCVEGTSTESENTVTANALLSDGRAAAGARLTVRSRRIAVKEGVPAWKILAADTADEQGRFKARLPSSGEFFLEIKAGGPAPQSGNAEVYFARFPDGAGGADSVRTFALSPSGSVKGSLRFRTGPPSVVCWVGVPGSSILVKLNPSAGTGDAAFELGGLYPGSYGLSVISLGDTGNTTQSTDTISQSTETLPEATVEPNLTTDMGSVLIGGAGSENP